MNIFKVQFQKHSVKREGHPKTKDKACAKQGRVKIAEHNIVGASAWEVYGDETMEGWQMG